MYTFYHTPTSCSTASHIALEESGIDYHPVLTKIYKPDEHQSYKQMVNPLGTVPALKTDSGVVTENLAIMAFIARLKPELSLLPDSPWELGQCLSFMSWLGSTVQIARRQFKKPSRFTDDERAHGAIKEFGALKFRDYLAQIEQRFRNGGPWVMGERYSVADGYALVIYHWAVLDELNMALYPNFTNHKQRLLERQAVRTVLERERCILLEG